jgi:hypothetical protein
VACLQRWGEIDVLARDERPASDRTPTVDQDPWTNRFRHLSAMAADSGEGLLSVHSLSGPSAQAAGRRKLPRCGHRDVARKTCRGSGKLPFTAASAKLLTAPGSWQVTFTRFQWNTPTSGFARRFEVGSLVWATGIQACVTQQSSSNLDPGRVQALPRTAGRGQRAAGMKLYAAGQTR